MLYVYLIRSLSFQDQTYIGITSNLNNRLKEHNAGESIHTSKFKPWNIILCIAFTEENKAKDFEKYLKSGSGRSFAKRHFW